MFTKCLYFLGQRSTKDGPCIKSSLLSVLVNQVFTYVVTPTHLHIVYSCFPITEAECNRCDRH